MEKLLFGAAYYDEYMPCERLSLDMQMIKKAGMNVIRIAESTWSTWEPFDNVYDFSHLHRMLQAALENHISVIVGTPTYAIPTWLSAKYPDILSDTHSGVSLYGHRQNMDITHPDYLFHAERIIRKLMEEVASYKNVIGFQLDNETKYYDTCGERVQKLFVSYLKEKFPDILEFNRDFGLDYWSNRIDDWEIFPDIRGTINGSLSAEFKKFQRSLVSDFLMFQSKIVSEYKRSDQFITHNFDYEWRDYSHGMQPEVNQYLAARAVTLAGVDIYHPTQDFLTGAEISFGGAIGRAMKKNNYLVLETQGQGTLGRIPYEGQLRLQAFSHLANGADSVMYWHWHSIHNSFESYWKGILSHDFKENAVYREACTIGADFKRLSDKLIHLHKKNSVAIIISNESLTGIDEFPMDSEGRFNYNDALRLIFDSFYELNIECDLIYSEEIATEGLSVLTPYRLVVAPALYSAETAVLSTLSAYVKAGGTLFATFKTGFSNEHIKIYHQAQPYLLTDCLGITYDQFTSPLNVDLTFCGNEDISSENSASYHPVSHWMELVIPVTADVLAFYKHKHWGKYAAITKNNYGAGQGFYLACVTDKETVKKLLRRILKDSGIALSSLSFPIIEKIGTNQYGKEIHYFFNYSDEAVEFGFPYSQGVELLSGKNVEMGQKIPLAMWDFLIVEL